MELERSAWRREEDMVWPWSKLESKSESENWWWQWSSLVNLRRQVQPMWRKLTLGPVIVGPAQKLGWWVKETITRGNPPMVSLAPTDDKGIWIRSEYNQVGGRGLIVPQGNSSPNGIWRLEQVLRESSKGMMIPWDSNESGNAWKVGRP